MNRLCNVACALLLLSGAPLLAQDEMMTDRPDFTEGTMPVAYGNFQLEAGASYVSDGGEHEQDYGEALLRIGVLPRIELRVGLSSFVDAGDGNQGWDGGSLGAKLRLTDGRGGAIPAIALQATVGTPWGGEDVASDGWQPAALLAFDWDLGADMGLGINTGWTRVDEGDATYDQAFWTASVAFDIVGDLGGFVEYAGNSREIQGGDATHYLHTGVTWGWKPNLQLDVHGGVGLVSAASDWFVGAGVATRF